MGSPSVIGAVVGFVLAGGAMHASLASTVGALSSLASHLPFAMPLLLKLPLGLLALGALAFIDFFILYFLSLTNSPDIGNKKDQTKNHFLIGLGATGVGLPLNAVVLLSMARMFSLY